MEGKVVSSAATPESYTKLGWNITEVYNESYDNVTRSNILVHEPPFDTNAVILSTSLIMPMMIFGVLANILTVYVICNSKKLKTIFNLLITSLCVSDCISALISPLFLYRRTWGFDHWIISNFLCKFFWGADNGTSISTSFHILCFSFLRLLSISWPHHYKRVSRFHAKMCLLAIWLLSIGFGFVPFALWFSARKMNRNVKSAETGWPSCTISLNWVYQFKNYSLFGYLVFFYIPFALVLMVSVSVSVIICKRRTERAKGKSKDDVAEVSRQRKENQAIVQLALVVGSFMLGYIPHTAYHIYAMNTKVTTHEDEVFHWWFGVVEYFCLRLSECLNPVFYNLASSKMRNETKKVLVRICVCCATEQTNPQGRMTISTTCESAKL
ncbi:growth hormone secretagogue receptor type 1-like [Ciona intestinalis]